MRVSNILGYTSNAPTAAIYGGVGGGGGEGDLIIDVVDVDDDGSNIMGNKI
jgi:hypothetical protein